MSHRNDNRTAYLFAGPWIAGIVFLSGVSLAFSFGLSLMSWDGVDASDARYIGAQHYRTLITVDTTYDLQANDPKSWRLLGGKPADPKLVLSLYNSIVYSVMAVPLGIVVALGLALLLNTTLRGIGLFRMLFYLPHRAGRRRDCLGVELDIQSALRAAEPGTVGIL